MKNDKLLKRITFNPKIMQGQPCIRGMRIPVSVVVSLVAEGLSAREILKDYPALEKADIKAALEYAAWLTSGRTIPIPAK